MTNSEALKKMQSVKAYMTSGNPIWSVTEIGEVFDMAIEALEKTQQVTGKLNSDCISRQAAIEEIARRDTTDGTIKVFSGKEVAEILNILPSEQPEIVRCKDCKHRPFDSEDTQGFGVEFPDEKCPCQCDDYWYNWRPNNEWFCANAERRTDG